MIVAKYVRHVLLAFVVGGAAVAGAVDAKRITYSTGFPPGSVGAQAAEAYADAINKYSDGELSVRVYAMSLLNFQETSSGLKDGIADSGVILVPYFQREFAHTNLVVDLSMLANLSAADPLSMSAAYAGAVAEFVIRDCPECQREFGRQKQVYTGQAVSSPMYLLCTRPVHTRNDLRGLRLRVGSPQLARWSTAMGATAVTLSTSETYEGLNQGVVDCTVSAYTDLKNFNLSEVVTDVVFAPGSVGAGIATNNINVDTWRGLTAEQRRAVLKSAAALSARFVLLYAEEGERALAAARRQQGVAAYEPAEELLAATRAFIEEDVVSIAEEYRKYGVPQSKAMIDTFRPILDKWLDLVKDVTTADDLAAIYWSEIYSKIDVDQYGL